MPMTSTSQIAAPSARSAPPAVPRRPSWPPVSRAPAWLKRACSPASGAARRRLPRCPASARTAGGTGAADDFDPAKVNEGGYVVRLRHVTAGGSDADDCGLADCRTRRQVGASGRAQAAELGARFKSAGVAEARVLSSQWCRAKQTAELLGLGPVVEEPALNYYHWKLGSEAAMNETLRGYLYALRAPLPGAPLVMVGHSTAFAPLGVAARKADRQSVGEGKGVAARVGTG